MSAVAHLALAGADLLRGDRLGDVSVRANGHECGHGVLRLLDGLDATVDDERNLGHTADTTDSKSMTMSDTTAGKQAINHFTGECSLPRRSKDSAFFLKSSEVHMILRVHQRHAASRLDFERSHHMTSNTLCCPDKRIADL